MGARAHAGFEIEIKQMVGTSASRASRYGGLSPPYSPAFAGHYEFRVIFL